MNKIFKINFLRKGLESLFLLSLLASVTRQACGKGCLSCHQDAESGTTSCKVCDVYNSYLKTLDGSCQKKQIENCEVPSLDHFAKPCLQCLPNFVLDPVRGKCVGVNISKLIPDCHRYSSLSTCISCNPDHFILIGKCVKSGTLVPDCVYYQSNGVCSECAKDRFLDQDKNECRDFPQSTGCKVYNTLRCDQCKPGFAQDFNFYLRISASDSMAESLALDDANSVQFSQMKDENCFPLNVPHCDVHETADKCVKCDAGYFVTEDRQCQENPQNRIDYCMLYASETACYECEFLYRESNGICVRRTLKPDCLKYERDSNDCVLCESGKKVSGGSCVSRGTAPSFCEELEPDSDDCKFCQKGYIKDNESACFSTIENCKTHGLDPANTAEHKKCTACEKDHFLKDSTTCELRKHQPQCKEVEPLLNLCKTCLPGYYNEAGLCKRYTIDFCNEFKSDANQCLSCIDGFKLDTGICKFVELNNCKTPSATDDTQCEVCVDGFFKDDSTKQCRMRNLIGCEDAEENKNECKICQEGYKKNTSTKQCYLELTPFCDDEDDTGCKSCRAGYRPNDYGTCSKILQNKSGCSNEGNSEDSICTACDDSNTHFLEPFTKTCIPRANTSNCSGFEPDEDFCSSCSGGYYVENGWCLPVTVDCLAPSKATNTTNKCSTCDIGFYLDPVTKNCLKNIEANCDGPAEKYGFGCKTCKSGFYLNFQTKLCEKIYIPHCSEYEAASLECKTCATGTYRFNGKCRKDFSLGCSEYITIPKNNEKICSKCIKGFYLNDGLCRINSIPNCEAFDANNLECTACRKGYYPDSNDKLTCLKQNVPYCVAYADNTNDCTKCESLFFVSSHRCAAVTMDYCVHSGGTTDDCEVCLSGYKIDSSGPSTVCSIIDFPISKPVENCFGNNTSENENCTLCNNNYDLFYMRQIFYKFPPHCSYVELNIPNICEECEEYYEFDPANSTVCRLAASITDCIQAKPFFKGLLSKASAASQCGKCKNDTHFIESDQCKPRTVQVVNCLEYDEASDTCSTCASPFNKAVTYHGEITCKTVTFAPDANCVLYDEDDLATKKCLACAIGKKGPTCADDSKLRLPEKFWGVDLSAATFGNEAQFESLDLATKENSFGLSGAKPKTGTLLATISKQSWMAYDLKSETAQFGVFINGITSSTSDTSSPANWFNNQIVTDCLYALQDGGKYICYACKAGKLGITNKVNAKKFFIEKCTDPALHYLEKNYDGVGYAGHDVMSGKSPLPTEFVNVSIMVNFDTCTNGLVPVAYFLIDSDHYYSTNFTTKRAIMECVEKIHEERLVENCQVYGYFAGGEVEPDVADSPDPRTKCVACKPGYEGSDFVGGKLYYIPNKCTRIKNCNLASAENTKMNSCGECKVGFAWEYSRSTLNVLFHRCIAAPDNCKVYDPFTKQCVLCAADYALNTQRVCKPKADLGCENLGVQELDFFGLDISATGSDIKNLGIINTYYLAKQINSSSGSPFCQTCSSANANIVPVQKDSSATEQGKACGYVGLTEFNCRIFEFSTTGNQCSVCNDGFMLDRTTKRCLKNDLYPEIPHCLETDTASLAKNQCLVCSEGAYLTNEVDQCPIDAPFVSTVLKLFAISRNAAWTLSAKHLISASVLLV